MRSGTRGAGPASPHLRAAGRAGAACGPEFPAPCSEKNHKYCVGLGGVAELGGTSVLPSQA